MTEIKTRDAARKEVEYILGRELGMNERMPIDNITDVGKILAMVMTDPNKSAYLQGYDSAAMMGHLMLRRVGVYRQSHDVGWICVPHLSGALCVVPGRRIADNLFVQIHIGRQTSPALTWIPTGQMTIQNVSVTAVTRNATQIETLIETAVSLRGKMRTELVTVAEADSNEAQMLSIKRQLDHLCHDLTTSTEEKPCQ